MAGLPLPLGSESQKIHERFCAIFKECIENNMTKDEILRYVHDKYLIPVQDTHRVWNHLERENPDLFIAYNASIRERNPQPLWNSPNVQQYAAASPQQALKKQNLQTSQQQLVIPNDFCQQILSALGQIIKLLSDGHGLGPHPTATGSLKRKRVGENEERGEIEEGEKLQENERNGNNEEAEKKEEGNGEELQKNEEGDNEGLQKKDEGDNEELQKNERGDN